jgi:hypothetical protein
MNADVKAQVGEALHTIRALQAVLPQLEQRLAGWLAQESSTRATPPHDDDLLTIDTAAAEAIGLVAARRNWMQSAAA